LQTDVLNPIRGYDPNLGDSMNPDYGFTRKRAATRSLQKAVGGIPYTRELGNTGHTFVLSWLGRTWNCVRRLKWFYEQFEDGYFTLIDWDGGARHYVGRFTTEVTPIETANNKWDVQNVQFEEIPQCAMLQYPNNWDEDSVWLYPANDFGDQKVATQGTWVLAAQMFGKIQRTVATAAAPAVGDWAQHEYRGYGFQLYALVGAGQGNAQVFVDGALAATVNLAGAGALIPKMVYEQVNLPLDLHRVQLVAQTAGAPVAWYGLRVMR
jgi:hypothetical protein